MNNEIIDNRIDKLRLKLLDMTRKNPLLSTKFSERSNSLIRIVDEIPELLLNDILTKHMRIASLPDLNAKLPDEQTREFEDALVEARLNDQDYIEGLNTIDQNSDDAPNLLAQKDMELKDRLREKLGLPPRQTKNNLSLQQHAKNHHILPSYELPLKNDQHEDGRHTDQDIQTLLLPDLMNRRLNALYSKERTWKEETGISVLHAAFGFLEWQDSNNNKSQFSPLILIPVQLEKKRTKGGQEFLVSSDITEPEGNKVLAEKLSLEFNITLTEYTGQDIEKYLQEIQEQNPNNMNRWQIRRWATIGVFPSARLAMYHDLKPNGWDFANHPIISALFGGSNTGHDATPFADEYDIDETEIENKVPYLIADADSSQFSTIVDIVNEKNLAVEGPPGTGKSQTIVNTIAAALSLNKKVLFVAEKSAALEVVKARLEAFDIGDFVLPLQANRSSKKEIISSIKNRIEMKPYNDPHELDQKITIFKNSRKKLKIYLDTLATNFAETDFTIYKILGASIKLSNIVDNLSDDVKEFNIPNIDKLNSEKLQDIVDKCEQIEKTLRIANKHADFWKIIQIANIDPFSAKELLKKASNTGKLFIALSQKRDNLELYHFEPKIALNNLQLIENIIDENANNLTNNNIDVAEKLLSAELIDKAQQYLNGINSWQTEKQNIQNHIISLLNKETLNKLNSINDICLKHGFQSFNQNDIDNVFKKHEKSLKDLQKAAYFLEQVSNISDVLSISSVADFIKAVNKLSATSIQALALRHQNLDDASLQLIFSKEIIKVRALKAQMKYLQQTFNLSGLPSLKIIKNHTLSIEQAGIFGFIDKKYRNAKRFYKSIDKTKNFKKNLATKKLRELSDWSLGVENFAENKTIRAILGDHYDGLYTDFSHFEQVIELFQYADKNFTKPYYEQLRTFIKYGDIQKIKSLPDLPDNHPIYNYSKLTTLQITEKIPVLEQQFSELNHDIKTLKNTTNLFKTPEQITITNIQELFSQLKQLLKTQKNLQDNNEISEILGETFEDTNKDNLQIIIKLARNLINLNEDERTALLSCMRENQLNNLKILITDIKIKDNEAYSAITEIAELTNTNSTDWTQNKTIEQISDFMRQASQDNNGLIAYSRFVAAKNNLEDEYANFIEKMLANNQYNLCVAIEALIMQKMAKEVYRAYGKNLTYYNGDTLSNFRKLLKEADCQVIKLSRQRLQRELFRGANPPVGNSRGRASTHSEMALLRHQVSLQRPSSSVRNLTKKAAEALLEIKPCWMMSPLAVAQYLPRDGITFDLLIVDEASQMPPEDAVGALIRAKQAMIVGDTNQLPPTNFFRQVFEDEEANEDETVTEESILEMANACFRPARRLRWHYRSKHSSLIAFSNKHIYNDNLVIFPSAYENNPEIGVSYEHIENGIYSSGINPKEAAAMVDAILKFMEDHSQKSLGVVLINQKQRDLLAEQMNYAVENNEHARNYKEKWKNKNDGLESFFIKNLENVQGDERDVIFIGTVYGAESAGAPVMQRFGPINGVAGKRRLNVLFSRAKERIITFSSMTSADIRAEENTNPGVYMLKKWLEYSATKILQSGEVYEREPDSEFEEHVIQQIKSIGCEAIPQVGVKGYSIDIGVKHPDWPHGFIMGVECDGATYHSSKSARDRDRLREEVLEGLGWNLYRIWSTDWFEDPMRETQKLREIITQRLSELQNINHQETTLF